MLHINYKSGQPLYEQLYRAVLTMAAAGALRPGEPLPSVRAVAQELDINPNTVQKAYALLEKDGITYSVPGKGSFLADSAAALHKKQRQALEGLRAAVAEALASGLGPQEILAAADAAAKTKGKDEADD